MICPDFIIPGFQKCGTTAIHYILTNQFNDVIYMATNNSGCGNSSIELDFFTPNNEPSKLGIEWYLSNFKEGLINGEKSPSYLVCYPYSIPMIRNLLPKVKLLIPIRNPVTRAFSAYNHYMQEYPKSKNWGIWDKEKSFWYNFFKMENNNFREYGLYHKAVSLILDNFPRKQVCFVVQEKLSDPNKYQSEWNKIIEFLDLPQRQIQSTYHHKRKYSVKFPEKTIKSVHEYYEKHNEKLFNLLGYEIDEWRE